MLNRKFRWIPPILWGILIAVLSLIPGGPGNLNIFGIPYFDKIGHFGMYSIWTFLIFIAFSGHHGIQLKKAFWLTFIIGTIVGILFEYAQFEMRLGRMFEYNDMIANGLGSLTGALCGLYYIHFRMRGKTINPKSNVQ